MASNYVSRTLATNIFATEFVRLSTLATQRCAEAVVSSTHPNQRQRGTRKPRIARAAAWQFHTGSAGSEGTRPTAWSPRFRESLPSGRRSGSGEGIFGEQNELSRHMKRGTNNSIASHLQRAAEKKPQHSHLRLLAGRTNAKQEE